MLFLDHDDFNFLLSSTISFLWWFIGDDIVLFFYVNFDSSVISLIKKVRNSNIMGCSKGRRHKHGIRKYTLDFLFMFRVKSLNSTFIFIFIDIDHVCRHSMHLLFKSFYHWEWNEFLLQPKRKPRYTLSWCLINSSRRISTWS